MSPRSLTRSPGFAGKEGVIIGRGRYYRSVRAQFDNNKTSTPLHRDYTGLIPPISQCRAVDSRALLPICLVQAGPPLESKKNRSV